jgi:hypothetical protein
MWLFQEMHPRDSVEFPKEGTIHVSNLQKLDQQTWTLSIDLDSTIQPTVLGYKVINKGLLTKSELRLLLSSPWKAQMGNFSMLWTK